jgi:hypothetical protein
MNALQFGRIAPAVAIGERDARRALATLEADPVPEPEVPSHA